MRARVLVLTVLCGAIPCVGSAQSVELMYTPGVLNDALALKDSLKVGMVHSSNALSLVGATADKKKSFGEKMAGATGIVIVGEDALKAAADIPFSIPVILVNAAGPTAATGQIVRVFDAATAPADAIPVSAYAVSKVITSGREVSIKGQVNPLVQAVLATFK